MFELRSILCGDCLSDGEGDDAALCHALKIALEGKLRLVVAQTAGQGQKPCDSRMRTVLERWGVLAPGGSLSELGFEPVPSPLTGVPEDALAQLVERTRPDLMVLGTQPGQDAGRWVPARLADALSQVGRVPTLFVPRGAAGLVGAGTGELRLGRVLVPVAAWPDASRAAQLAQRLASTLKVGSIRYRTLHVGKRRDAPTLDRMHDGAIWEHVDLEGELVPTLLRQADDFGADLVVMATEGHDRLGSQLLGDAAERVVRESGCPVLSAPPRA